MGVTMGVSVARAPGSAPLQDLPSKLQATDISSYDDLEDLREDVVRDESQLYSASFRAFSEAITDVRLSGEIDSLDQSPWDNSGELSSFTVRYSDGESVRFSVEDGSIEAYQYEDSSGESVPSSPDSLALFSFACAMLYAMNQVDRFIDRNGLRPVVDEVKERRWVILITLYLLSFYCQTNSC